MSIWNKILVACIGVASLFFFHAAARTLKTYQYWSGAAQQISQKLETLQNSNRELGEADAEHPLKDGSIGVRALQAKLSLLLVARGRVWEKCEPQRPDPRTGRVVINTDPAAPSHITTNMVFYVFEDSEEKKDGHYVGEFKVREVGENKVTLEPATVAMDRLSERQRARLMGSHGPWLLYELMPVDRHSVFAGLSEEEKKALLPADTVAEYLKDGAPAAAGDAKENVVDGNYRRSLRDYAEIFRADRAAVTMYVDSFESLSRDEQYLKEALADAKRQIEFTDAEVARLKSQVALGKKEEKAVADHLATLKSMFAGLQEIVTRQIRGNLSVAAEIARLQWQAARHSDEQAHAMVDKGPWN